MPARWGIGHAAQPAALTPAGTRGGAGRGGRGTADEAKRNAVPGRCGRSALRGSLGIPPMVQLPSTGFALALELTSG